MSTSLHPLGHAEEADVELPGRQGVLSSAPAKFFARRLLSGLVSLVVASALIFLAVQALPGDVATQVLGRSVTPQRVASIRSELHLNEPVTGQYFTFVSHLVQGNLGYSTAALAQGERLRVSTAIGKPFRNSLILAAITILIFIPLCLLFGSISALRAGKLTDTVISSSSLAIGSLPEFLVGTLLVLIFFSLLNVLPPVSSIPPGASPLAHISSLILPVCTLLGVSLAFGTRLLRASMIQTLDFDYVAMARLRGYREGRGYFRSSREILVIARFLAGEGGMGMRSNRGYRRARAITGV